MGMIRVSDETEQRLKSISDGRSIGATVEMCLNALENMAADEEKKENSGAWARLATHIDERLDELKSLIEDTTVDRLAQSPSRKQTKPPIAIEWPDVQYIFFELLEEDAPEWACKEASRGAHEGNDLEWVTWLADEEFIYTEGQGRTNWVKLSPRVKEYLGGKYDI